MYHVITVWVPATLGLALETASTRVLQTLMYSIPAAGMTDDRGCCTPTQPCLQPPSPTSAEGLILGCVSVRDLEKEMRSPFHAAYDECEPGPELNDSIVRSYLDVEGYLRAVRS